MGALLAHVGRRDALVRVHGTVPWHPAGALLTGRRTRRRIDPAWSVPGAQVAKWKNVTREVEEHHQFVGVGREAQRPAGAATGAPGFFS
jgi:hypothetical protein